MISLIILSGLAILARGSVVDTPAQNIFDGVSTSLDTTTTYSYNYDTLDVIPPSIQNSFIFRFRVQANNDVHIALSSQNTDQAHMYEIVIGGWGNTQSVIRRCKQCTNLNTAATSQILSRTQYRDFWIKYSNTGLIQVGRGYEATAFMQWTDPNPLAVRYFGFSTGWGSTGSWKFPPEYVVSTCGQLIYTTDTTYSYRFTLPIIPSYASNNFEFVFLAQASNDVHILLASGFTGSQTGYEIVIGGWSDTKSVVRRCKQCNEVTSASTIDYLSPSELRKFRISYDNGHILVFRNDESLAFLSYTDNNPITPIKTIGYSTGWGSTGRFVFEEGLLSGNLVFDTTSTYSYRYELPLVPSAKGTDLELIFLAQANNDVHVALAPQKGLNGNEALYEIVIGGWRNSRSVIRRCKQCENLASTTHTPLLSSTEMRLFRITVSAGVVNVYSGQSDCPFMSYHDPAHLTIGAVGFSTGWGSNGRFAFQTCNLF